MSDSLRPHGLQPTRLLRPWGFPSKSAGVGCHRLLREWGARALQNGACECQCFCSRTTHSNGCCHHLHLKGKSKWPPASLGGSLSSASGSAPGSFQITASVLGLKSYKILCAPFKSGVSAFYSPLALPCNSRVVRMCYN